MLDYLGPLPGLGASFGSILVERYMLSLLTGLL